jgi:hydrogenase nickel incorporation protein HypA/HybF
MHEASLVRSLLRQVEELAQRHGARRVTGVRVTVGEFSGVEPDLLVAAFERQIKGTPLDGTRLLLERVELAAQCTACGHEFSVERFDFTCPNCRLPGAGKMTRGEELMLESLELEAAE